MKEEEYLKKIINLSTFISEEDKYTIYSFKHNSGNIMYYHNKEGGYDKYKRNDQNKLMDTQLYSLCTPKGFCNTFIPIDNKNLPSIALSTEEIKKIPLKMFYNKENIRYLFDRDGYYYIVLKYDLPTKNKVKEWNKFSKDDAVLVSYPNKNNGYLSIYNWFINIDDFKIFWENYKEYGMTYNIKRIGYYIHPEKRKIYYRLPYFDIQKEYELDKNTYSLARSWVGIMKETEFFKYWGNCISMIEKLIIKRMEYEKENQ